VTPLLKCSLSIRDYISNQYLKKTRSIDTSMLHKKKIIKKQTSWMWWLTPIIPTTWEAEIGRIRVQGQPGQKVSKTPQPNQ
jgi:hypothetical protein